MPALEPGRALPSLARLQPGAALAPRQATTDPHFPLFRALAERRRLRLTHAQEAPMAVQALVTRSPTTPLLNRFTGEVAKANTPSAVLDALDDFAVRLLPINVLGAGRMPARTSDWP